MTDQNSQFFAILTAVGEAKQANAAALGTSWTFAQMAVGDANGTDPIPSRTQTKLINERRRAPLNQVKVDPANASVIIAEQIIPESVGGWWVRELALYDADGDMVAVANCAPTFKPLLNQGSGRTQVIRINLIVSSTANIELKIDPSVVLATREYVDTVIVEALSKLDYKHSVLAATTANITLSGIQTIDGELLPAGARVLVKDQAQAKENGIYVLPAAGAWKRALDADTSVEVTPGLFVSVEKGTVNGDSVWQLVTDAPIVLGTTALAFEMVAGRTGVSAGAYTKVTVDKYGRVIAGTTPTTLAGHGITDTYTKDEIAAMIAQASALPVGSMIGFPVDKVAPGFLELDGSVKSAAAYPDLATFLGGAFNKGDEGAGNFRLPESRAEFLRGWDHGRGVDAGRSLGSYQLDGIQGFRLETMRALSGDTWGNDNGGAGAPASGPPLGTGTPGVRPRNLTGAFVTDGVNGVPRVGSETRPRNLAVMWCIKAWNAPINQGNIDVAALETEVRALRKMTLSGYKGLYVSATGTNALIAIRARSLTIGGGVSARVVEFLDLIVNLGTLGLGGLDAGVLAASSWYSTWVATNGEVTAGIAALIPIVTGNTTAGSAVIPGIASTASMRPGMQFSGASFPPGAFIKSVDSPTQITASVPAITTGAGALLRFVYEPLLPAGYIAKRVNAFVTDATANKYPLCFDQTGGRVTMSPRAGTNGASNIAMAQGVQGTISGTGVSVSIDPFVPPTASAIEIFISTQSSSGGTVQVGRAGSLLVGIVLSITNEANQFSSAVITLDSVGRSLNFASNLTAGILGCRGWEDNL
ncbi:MULTISPECIES: phage tail-collar fiber domain-containing protein [Pseudomonas]|uniref:Phage tail protein n=1 Tax=Pseudomonas tritici TaxID=2745518 RepID=A0A8H9YK02_9PSED|nr:MULTISPECIES: phage tail protein [Pseudomonas]MBP2872920.1 phage tail protein [Pseudomonas sp. SWRI144]QXH82654.1 phage tail protein [Pseudomonas tritici]